MICIECFGVLLKNFQILKRLPRLWNSEDMKNVDMFAIFENMVVGERK